MPAIENVTRRAAVYWWRRRIRFVAANLDPITIATTVSLLTKEQAVARRRAAAMTGRSEGLRVSLYEKIKQDGLTAEQVTSLLQTEMVQYRNMLAYQHSAIQADGAGDVQLRLSQMLRIYAALNNDFAMNGFSDYMGIDYVGGFDQRFAGLDDEAREHLSAMLNRAGDLPASMLAEARDLLGSVRLAVTDDRLENARRVMCEARAMIAKAYDEPSARSLADTLSVVAALVRGNPLQTQATLALPTAVTLPIVATPNPLSGRTVCDLSEEQQRFAAMTALEAVDEYFRVKPQAGGKRDGDSAIKVGKNKSQPKVWGTSQRRQFRTAAFLFGKSAVGQPMAAMSQNDLNVFYDHLTRMPTSHHKSPRHEAMPLEAICSQALIDYKEDDSFGIGLDVGTVNRHFANVQRLSKWLAAKTPMRALDFSDFILEEEDRDQRDERDPYTIEQGLELFKLGIWTGSASLEDRYHPKSGDSIWHDAAYWVMALVWYSGMRREECCKLLIDDIGEENGITFFNIRSTVAGRVKTARSVRKVPVHPELIRLGFIEYVAAMRVAGETCLFPDIMPGRSGRKQGDVFFKQVWLKIKPCLQQIRPGQAVHSGRHMVSTELKILQTFEEFRADLLGQVFGGENASRYSGATNLEILVDVVVRIPNVTSHISNCKDIRLLPDSLRKARPVREHFGRRERI
ncbi:integrase [Sphingomonas montana]|uniref:integrase n=1 Tax=Sphingomonas montana TaxID=1843236 RepID=UPI00096D3F30|nr:integrase [Sphingomonas montana]